ncbi:glucosamine-6-phosphate deaminase [Saccharospirillum sp.]|uniref:glucosamine-6-phosphate deaminase n=1 Tax=Saccharospirillum sp. TaxID=2033801 RepID=UPI0034A03339
MKIVILETPEHVAQYGAELISKQLASKPASVLGLATGSTPVALYNELIARCRTSEVSFSQATTFNLDEYLGLDAQHPQSYRYFMDKHLFNQVNIDPANTYVPNGTSADPIAECEAYELKLEKAGGVDLQLLGLGHNGHIGFNEPTSSLGSRTRIKTLTPETIKANQRFFSEGEFQPTLAITMGIGTIMESKQVVLLATGAAKSDAVVEMIEGPIAARCPASILQLHPKVTVILDRAASQGLENSCFYELTEARNQELLHHRQSRSQSR